MRISKNPKNLSLFPDEPKSAVLQHSGRTALVQVLQGFCMGFV